MRSIDILVARATRVVVFVTLSLSLAVKEIKAYRIEYSWPRSDTGKPAVYCVLLTMINSEC